MSEIKLTNVNVQMFIELMKRSIPNAGTIIEIDGDDLTLYSTYVSVCKKSHTKLSAIAESVTNDIPSVVTCYLWSPDFSILNCTETAEITFVVNDNNVTTVKICYTLEGVSNPITIVLKTCSPDWIRTANIRKPKTERFVVEDTDNKFSIDNPTDNLFKLLAKLYKTTTNKSLYMHTKDDKINISAINCSSTSDVDVINDYISAEQFDAFAKIEKLFKFDMNLEKNSNDENIVVLDYANMMSAMDTKNADSVYEVSYNNVLMRISSVYECIETVSLVAFYQFEN